MAGALAGLAGALYAPLEGFVYPNQLGLVASTSFIVWVAIGGRGTLIGAFVGAVVVNEVQSELSDRFQEYWPLLIGCFLVVVILFEPGGRRRRMAPARRRSRFDAEMVPCSRLTRSRSTTAVSPRSLA